MEENICVGSPGYTVLVQDKTKNWPRSANRGSAKREFRWAKVQHMQGEERELKSIINKNSKIV